MVYLSENEKALIKISLLELDKHTYLLLQAKYKDKVDTILYKGWLHNIGQNTSRIWKEIDFLLRCVSKKTEF